MPEHESTQHLITGAGIVILAPFLPTLFERAGCPLSAGNTNTANKRKAMQLMHYLVYDHQPVAETDIFLPQLLCNHSLQESETTFISLNKKEEELCDHLLQQVIWQWQKIHHTTIDGLRDSFLQREGKLIVEEDEAHLIVKQRGYDVLLSSLPWTIAVTKFSWMDKPLFTTWR